MIQRQNGDRDDARRRHKKYEKNTNEEQGSKRVGSRNEKKKTEEINDAVTGGVP